MDWRKKSIINLSDDFNSMYDSVIKSLVTYLEDNPQIQNLILGISGGIDSAVIASLGRAVCNIIPTVKLVGRCLPIESNTFEMIRAVDVGEAFCDDFMLISNIEKGYHVMRNYIWFEDSYKGYKDVTFDDKVRAGNLKARLRMMYLFDLAHKFNGMVLGTDNLTEFCLGFWTLHGDVGNYEMVQNLWKTEVYGLAEYIIENYDKVDLQKTDAIQQCISAVPTDGLGITESDFDQIGVKSYLEADKLLIKYLLREDIDEEHLIIKMHKRTEFKRRDPINVPRGIALGLGM